MSRYEPGEVLPLSEKQPSRTAEWGFRFEQWLPESFTATRALVFVGLAMMLLYIL